jgi:glycosyltransferase involved in cell wall biosynthesis
MNSTHSSTRVIAGAHHRERPLTVLVLRSVSGAGGGAESIIVRTAARVDPSDARLIICAFRRTDDNSFDFDRQVRQTGCSYREIMQASRFDRSVWPQLKRVFDECRPDIVECHDYKSGYYASRLARVYGVPAVATLHGWSGHSVMEKYIYYPCDKLNVRTFPAIITVSSQIRDTMIWWGAKPAALLPLPNAIDSNEFHKSDSARLRIRRELAVEPDRILIGSAGRLVQEKRFDVLIDAIRLLQHKRLPVMLVVAGEGQLRECLAARIERLGLADTCHLLGRRQDMSDWYSALDIYAQSSDNEGTPGVLVEAMSCEIPIVATNVGGTGDLLEHGASALLVPRRSPQLLANGMEQLIADRQLATRLATTARLRVRTDFEFATRTKKLLGVYRSLAK